MGKKDREEIVRLQRQESEEMDGRKGLSDIDKNVIKLMFGTISDLLFELIRCQNDSPTNLQRYRVLKKEYDREVLSKIKEW